MVTIDREDDGAKGRFVLYDNGQFAGEITYKWEGKAKIVLDHTHVEEAFGGKGYGKQLVMRVVEFAREQWIKIVPVCPFAKAAFDKDESIRDVRV